MKIGIIGSGPGGLTVAKILTDQGFQVSIFEKGKFFSQRDGPTPYSVSEMDKKYKDKGVTVALGKVNVNYAEGACFGGGSEVNAGLYHRTPNFILKDWKENHGIDFADESVLRKHYEFSEKILNIGKMPFPPPASSQKICEGASSLGWQYSEAPRWFKYETKEDKGIFSGIRQSMSESVFPKINKENLVLFLNTSVDRVSETKNGKVRIKFQKNCSGQKNEKLFDFVFVACGAIGTPHLLKKSGLGGRLVGQNLRLHTSIKATARFKEKVNGPGAGIPVHQVKEFLPHFSIGGSISNLPFLAAGLSDNRVNPLDLSKVWHYYAAYYVAVLTGKGKIISLPLIKDPIVKFDVGEDGMRYLATGLKKLCELLFAAGAVEIFPSIKNFTKLQSQQDINFLPSIIPEKTASLMTIHLLGTCAIGNNKNSCVDLTGKLNGSKRIYVADSSIIPTALGVNPQGTVMALASYLATKFYQRYGNE